MNSSLLRAPSLLVPSPKTQTLEILHGRISISEWPQTRSWGRMRVITMKDRSKNRKPIQRGRYLSIEAIQAVQALKRAKISGADSLHRVLESKVRRLIKADMVAVLRELQTQGEGLLALQVFEEVRKEYWYKPQLLVYIDMIKVLARNGLLDKVQLVCSYLKTECWEADTEGFNSLLGTLLEFGFTQSAMDCYRLMKLWNSEPDESTFRILINGLESMGKTDLSMALKQEGEMYFGGPLDFLEKTEEMASTGVAESLIRRISEVTNFANMALIFQTEPSKTGKKDPGIGENVNRGSWWLTEQVPGALTGRTGELSSDPNA